MVSSVKQLPTPVLKFGVSLVWALLPAIVLAWFAWLIDLAAMLALGIVAMFASTVTVLPEDDVFFTFGCGTWTLQTEPYL